MSVILKCLALSFMTGIACKIFFETLIPRRKMRYGWMENTFLLTFALGFMIISMTPVPPYMLRPVRVVIVIFIVVQIYFKIRPLHNLILSILVCSLMWIMEMLVLWAIFALPVRYRMLVYLEEEIAYSLLFGLMFLFSVCYKGKKNMLSGTNWIRYGYVPIVVMVMIMVLSSIPWNEQEPDGKAGFLLFAMFGIMMMFIFYFIWNILQKERELQELRMIQEQTQNQMAMYQNMQRNYEQQRRYLHDYKNQLACIQGMLAEGEVERTAGYVAELTGNVHKSADYVDANHMVVNVVLNQKYREAMEKGITMLITIGDLSKLALKEEDTVTLLVNLLDNAIEACEKQKTGKMIHFKMVLEDGQLVLSVRNPVEEPVKIRGNTVITTKKDKSAHGIGLKNVDSVIQRNNGTSVIQCKDGMFSFSAILSS